MLIELRAPPGRCDEAVFGRVVQEYSPDGVAHRAYVTGRPVDGNEERRPEANERVIGDDVELLAGAAEHFGRLADGHAGVEFGKPAVHTRNPTAADRGHYGLARMLLAEVNHAVVVTDDFDVSAIERVVERE